MKRRVLILGIDWHLVRACRQLEVQPMVVVGAPNRRFGLAKLGRDVEALHVADVSNLNEVLAAIFRTGRQSTIVGVITTSESALVTAAALRQALGLTGRSPLAEILMRDKFLQKAAIREVGVPTVETVVVAPDEDLPQLPFVCGVAKPIAGEGTSLTTRFHGMDEAQAALEAIRRGDSSAVLFESLQVGDELTLDGIVVEGALAFVSVGRYEIPCLDTLAQRRPLQTFKHDPQVDIGLYRMCRPFARDALAALGFGSGVFHMEIFHDPVAGTLSFGECAGRRGGGLTQEEVWAKFGVDLARAAVSLAVGAQPELAPTIRPGVIGKTFLPATSGILLRVPTAVELMNLPGVMHAQVETPRGMLLGDPTDTVGRIGQVLVHGNDVTDWRRKVDAVLAFAANATQLLPVTATGRQLRELMEQG